MTLATGVDEKSTRDLLTDGFAPGDSAVSGAVTAASALLMADRSTWVDVRLSGVSVFLASVWPAFASVLVVPWSVNTETSRRPAAMLRSTSLLVTCDVPTPGALVAASTG